MMKVKERKITNPVINTMIFIFPVKNLMVKLKLMKDPRYSIFCGLMKDIQNGRVMIWKNFVIPNLILSKKHWYTNYSKFSFIAFTTLKVISRLHLNHLNSLAFSDIFRNFINWITFEKFVKRLRMWMLCTRRQK